MAIELGRGQFGIDILKILCIPSTGARRIALTVEVDDIVRVDIERLLYKDEAKKIKEIMMEHYVFNVKGKCLEKL